MDLKKSAVVLAGGFSKRFGRDKCLVELAGKPLVVHALERVSNLVDERIVVVSSEAQRRALFNMLGSRARLVVDKYEGQSPLVGALTGFEIVQGEYSLLLPCDTPFVSSGVAELLFDLCVNRSAVIPRWPNGFIEPLQAVYRAESAAAAARVALEEGKHNLSSMIARMHRVRYLSTLVLQQLDPKLLTFFNVNTPIDLRRAESLIGKGR